MSGYQSGRRRLFVLLLLGLLPASYLARVCVESYRRYGFLKGDNHGWEGALHRADPELGVAPQPGSVGWQLVPAGERVPYRYDSAGFRVPFEREKEQAGAAPLVLALGGSYTNGAGCAAEEAFPYLVAEGLGGRGLNSGLGSYGLAQMLVLARRLIPRYRPDVVLVQFSNWLVSRSQVYYAPTYFGRLPTPYFTGHARTPLVVAPPVFQTTLFRYDWGEYRAGRRSPWNFASFLLTIGFPAQAEEDWRVARFRLRDLVGRNPAPVRDRQEIIATVYRELGSLARRSGAQPIFVRLASGSPLPDAEFESLEAVPQAVLVDAEAALWRALSTPTEDGYSRAYMHWRGDPPVLVDPHPNARAHRIIADSVLHELRREPDRTGGPG